MYIAKKAHAPRAVATDTYDHLNILYTSPHPLAARGPGGRVASHPAAPPNSRSTSRIVGRNGGIAFQHRSNALQNASSCSAVKHMSGIAGAPRQGRTPRRMSSVTARSLRRCGYGKSLVATYDDDPR